MGGFWPNAFFFFGEGGVPAIELIIYKLGENLQMSGIVENSNAATKAFPCLRWYSQVTSVISKSFASTNFLPNYSRNGKMYLCIMVDASWEISEPISLLTISHHGWPLRHIWHHFENHHGKLVQLQVPQVPLWSEVESTFCSQPEAAPLGRFRWIWGVWMVGVLEVSSCGRDGIGTRLWRNQPSHPHWQRLRRSRLGCVLRTDLRGCSRWIHGVQVGAGRSAAVHQVLGDYCKQILHDGQQKDDGKNHGKPP